jgi:small subunit ribosomal protein S16
MLVIRLQRTGRKGHAQFRVVVQDSRRTPSSGRVVALLGAYNPHTKSAEINKELAAKYLANGAQPSDRVVRLLQAEGVKLPSWVKLPSQKAGKLRNQDKLRRNRPAEEVAPVEEAEAAVAEDAAVEAPTEPEEVADAEPTEAESPAEETPEA